MAPTINTVPTATPIHVSALVKNPLGLMSCHTVAGTAALSTPPLPCVHTWLAPLNATDGSPIMRRTNRWPSTFEPKNTHSMMYSTSGGRMAHNMTARLAQADTSISQPAIGKYQSAVVMMQYTHRT